MRKILFFAVALSTIVVVSSCRQDEPDMPSRTDPVEVQYSFVSSKAVPAENTTFGFLSYVHNKTTNQTADQPPATANGVRAFGAYAYQSAATESILVPCSVDSVTNYSYVARDPSKGQALDTACYKTICYSPAMPVFSYIGTQRIRFTRDQELLVAKHPFEMDVTGYNVFDFPVLFGGVLELFDVRSKITINVIQGASSVFTIDNPKLVNAGTFGWYHPMQQFTTISYGATSHPLDNMDFTLGNEVPFDTELVYDPDGLGNGLGNTIYRAAREPVFANNYASDGTVLPIRLDFTLDMGGGNEFDMKIPLGIDMVGSTHYVFNLTVKSTIVTLSYIVADWEFGYESNNPSGPWGGGTPEDIGGPGFMVICTWNIDTWTGQYGGGTPEDIGD